MRAASRSAAIISGFGSKLVDQGSRRLSSTKRIAGEKFGNRNERTLVAINNLAKLLMDQGHHDEAAPLYREAMEQREELGTRHPAILCSTNNYASLLYYQGNHAEATPLFRDVLEGRRQVLGARHPSTLTSINNYAASLEAQGHHSEATTGADILIPSTRVGR